MNIIVAGRIIRSETEYREAALGHPDQSVRELKDFTTPSAQDLADFTEFVEDTSSGSDVDAENLNTLRGKVFRLAQAEAQREQRLARIVPLPRRRGVAREVWAA